MKKILFITHWYPPNNSANSRCIYKIIQKLLKVYNYEIHCIVNDNSISKKSKNIHIHTIHRTFFSILLQWADIKQSSKLKTLFLKIRLLSTRLSQVLMIPFYPLYAPIQTLKFALKAIFLHKQEKFDIVVTDYFGFDTLFAGYILKKNNPSIVFVPIFWDSLTGGILPKYLPQSYSRKRVFNLEKKILQLSNRTICLQSHKQHMMNLWQTTNLYNKISFLDIPYFDDISITKESFTSIDYINKNTINIIYAGSLSNRNSQYIIDVIHLIKKHPINLIFFCNEIFHKRIIKENSKYKTNKVKIYAYIDNKELLNVMMHADILLNIDTDNATAIPSKIFEYMSLGKPIISTFKINQDPCIPYLKKYKLCLLLDERKSIENSAKLLSNFIDNKIGQVIKYQTLLAEYPLNTPNVYCEIINQVATEIK